MLCWLQLGLLLCSSYAHRSECTFSPDTLLGVLTRGADCLQVWQALYEQAQTVGSELPPPAAALSPNRLSDAAAALASHPCGCAATPDATPDAPPPAPLDASAVTAEAEAVIDELSAAFEAMAESLKRAAPKPQPPAAPEVEPAAATDRSKAVRDVSDAIQQLHERGYSINYMAVRHKGPVTKRSYASLKDQVVRKARPQPQAPDAAAGQAGEDGGAAPAKSLQSCIADAAQAHVAGPAAAVPAAAADAVAPEKQGAEYVWVINGSVSARVRTLPDKPVKTQPPASDSTVPLAVARLNADRLVPPMLRPEAVSSTEVEAAVPSQEAQEPVPPKLEAIPVVDAAVQLGEDVIAGADVAVAPSATDAGVVCSEAAAPAVQLPRPKFKTFRSPMHGRHVHPMAQLLSLATVAPATAAPAQAAVAPAATAAAAVDAPPSVAAEDSVAPPATAETAVETPPVAVEVPGAVVQEAPQAVAVEQPDADVAAKPAVEVVASEAQYELYNQGGRMVVRRRQPKAAEKKVRLALPDTHSLMICH